MLRVTGIRREQTKFGAELRATISCDEDENLKNAVVWMRYPLEYYKSISLNGNPFVAAFLLPAMRLGVTLSIEGAISRKMRQGINKFMEIMHQWIPDYRPVEIDTGKVIETFGEGQSTATFFSGGVDSSYTLLKNENSNCRSSEKISHLIFVRGFDISLDSDNDELFDHALKGVNAVAQELGKKVVHVSTNLRTITDRLANWSWFHGQAMMSIALGLDGLLKRVYVPATHTYNQLFPWGSHPLLDPLWATESLDVVHDGCEATRVQKIIKYIANSQVALDNLRVCWGNRYGRYNCGICEKCVRTMVNLEIAGVLNRCKTFDRKLNYRRVKNLRLTSENSRAFIRENYDALVTRGGDPQLLKALSKCLSPWGRYRPKNIIRSLIPMPAVRHLVRKIDQKLFQARFRNWLKNRSGKT